MNFVDNLEIVKTEDKFGILYFGNREIVNYIILDSLYKELVEEFKLSKDGCLAILGKNIFEDNEIEISNIEHIKKHTRKPKKFMLFHTSVYKNMLKERILEFNLNDKETAITYAIHMANCADVSLSLSIAIDIDYMYKYIKSFYKHIKILKDNIVIEKEDIIELLIKDSIMYNSSMLINYSFDIQKRGISVDPTNDIIFTYNKIVRNNTYEIIDTNDSMDISLFNKYSEDIELIKSMFTKYNDNNIFICGDVGLGKTEMVKSIAKSMNKKLIEINGNTYNIGLMASEYKSPIDVILYKLENFVKKVGIEDLDNYIVLVDECDDLFNSSSEFIGMGSKKSINDILDTKINKIFISNYNDFERSVIRRFDLIVEMKNRYKDNKKDFIIKNFKVLNNDFIVNQIVKNEYVTMNSLNRCLKVMDCKDQYTDKDIVKYLNKYLKYSGIYGKKIKMKKKEKSIDKEYNFNFINTDIDVLDMINNLKEMDQKSARLLLYGPPGSGKSEFAKKLSEELDLKYILVKNSDILSKYVGDSEKKIAKIFKKAKESNKALIFDEIDSFIYDRSSDVKIHEANLVNEFLQQLDDFDGTLIATTNMLNSLDKASIRRFDLKTEFKPIKLEKLYELFDMYLKEFKLKKSKEYNQIKDNMDKLYGLTLGDFKSVKRNHTFNKIKSDKELFERLLNENKLKNKQVKVGF